MKRKRVLFCVLFVFVSLSIIFFFKGSRFSAANYVRHHRVELERFAVDGIENDNREKIISYNGWEVSFYQKHGIVEFVTASRGIVPASTYEGFYYSMQDKPMGFQGTEVEFRREGRGWKWEEPGGDNWEYTERITDKWYWFTISF